MATEGRTNSMKPVRNAVAVDVSAADQTMEVVTAGVYVGGAGVLEVNMAGVGAAVVFTCPAGALLPIQVTKILTANTTATLIVALY